MHSTENVFYFLENNTGLKLLEHKHSFGKTGLLMQKKKSIQFMKVYDHSTNLYLSCRYLVSSVVPLSCMLLVLNFVFSLIIVFIVFSCKRPPFYIGLRKKYIKGFYYTKTSVFRFIKCRVYPYQKSWVSKPF